MGEHGRNEGLNIVGDDERPAPNGGLEIPPARMDYGGDVGDTAGSGEGSGGGVRGATKTLMDGYKKKLRSSGSVSHRQPPWLAASAPTMLT